MSLTSKIYTNEDYAGSITLADDGKFSLDPADPEYSNLLNSIVAEPVFVPIGDKLEDVHADKDPVLWIEYLAAHYKSQGLRATAAEEVDGSADDSVAPPTPELPSELPE